MAIDPRILKALPGARITQSRVDPRKILAALTESMPAGQARDIRDKLMSAYLGQPAPVKSVMRRSGDLEEALAEILRSPVDEAWGRGHPAVSQLSETPELQELLMSSQRNARREAQETITEAQARQMMAEEALPSYPRGKGGPPPEKDPGYVLRQLEANERTPDPFVRRQSEQLDPFEGSGYTHYEVGSKSEDLFAAKGDQFDPFESPDAPSYITTGEVPAHFPGGMHQRPTGEWRYNSPGDSAADLESLQKFFNRWPPPSSGGLGELSRTRKTVMPEVVRTSPKDPGYRERKLRSRIEEDAPPGEVGFVEGPPDVGRGVVAAMTRDRGGESLRGALPTGQYGGLDERILRDLSRATTKAEVVDVFRRYKVAEGNPAFQKAAAVARDPSKSLEVARGRSATSQSFRDPPADWLGEEREVIEELSGMLRTPDATPEQMGYVQAADNLMKQLDVLSQEGRLARGSGNQALAEQLSELVRTMRRELRGVLRGE